MGTQEYLLEKAKNTGIQEGLEKGIQVGLEKGIQQGLEKGIQQGHEKGVQQGIEKGKLIEREKALQEKKAIAWKLKDMGLPLAEIANIINVELSTLDDFLARS